MAIEINPWQHGYAFGNANTPHLIRVGIAFSSAGVVYAWLPDTLPLLIPALLRCWRLASSIP
jgi:hypothetical protein